MIFLHVFIVYRLLDTFCVVVFYYMTAVLL